MLIDLELISDVAVTASSATATTHETLTFLPGQCLLGAVAKQAYGALGTDAFGVFHGGRVRFGCAYPVAADGASSWPVPLALHRAKDQRDAPLANLARARPPGPTQWQAVSRGFVTAEGVLVSPRTAHSMRTAIGAQGRARDGFLFTIEALERGQRFRAELEADSPSLLAAVTAHLAAGSTIAVGRSRSAEFGSARITAPSASATGAPPTRAFAPGVTRVLYWCLSDVCLRDATTGQPTLVPTARDMGLPSDWTYDATHSFVRVRRYSPFNGTRRRPDLERQVLSGGSVLAFERATPLTELEWSAAGAMRVVGEHVSEGLGRVVFEPTLLAVDHVSLREQSPPNDATHAPQPDDPLARWASAAADRRKLDDAAWELAVALADDVGRRAWKLPASQWGELRRFARAHQGASAAALAQAVARRIGDQGTRAARWKGPPLAWLQAELSKVQLAAPGPARVLEILAAHAVRAGRRNAERDA